MRVTALFVIGAFALASCVGAPAGPIGYPPISQAQGPQPAQQIVAYGSHCSAGFYQCPLAQMLPLGAPCSCPGIGAPSFGNVQ